MSAADIATVRDALAAIGVQVSVRKTRHSGFVVQVRRNEGNLLVDVHDEDYELAVDKAAEKVAAHLDADQIEAFRTVLMGRQS